MIINLIDVDKIDKPYKYVTSCEVSEDKTTQSLSCTITYSKPWSEQCLIMLDLPLTNKFQNSKKSKILNQD